MKNNDFAEILEDEPITFRITGYSEDYDHYIDMYDVYLEDKIMKVIDFL